MENAEIASVFTLIADILELEDENPFKVRAYRNAARIVDSLGDSVAGRVTRDEDLTEIPGVGKEIAAKIEELVRTSRLSFLERIRAEIPAGLLDLLRLRGVGPKTARQVWKELGITSVAQLDAAARAGDLARLTGFGKKSEEKILKAIQDFHSLGHRTLLSTAEPVVESLKSRLMGAPGVQRVEAAGSFRRRRETVGDLDILVIAEEGDPVMEHLKTWDQVAEVESVGSTRCTVVLRNGLHVDVRVVAEQSFGAALCYFTGSKDHDIRLRKLAQERGLRLSEYGLIRPMEQRVDREDDAADHLVASRTEAEIYAGLGLPYIPPEIREDIGEIEAAQAGSLPHLIELADIKGDLQMHSRWSDGRNSVEEMLLACAALGYEYLAISDHSKSLTIASGLNGDDLRRQRQEMDEVGARHPEIRLLRSAEVDILADGSLDLEDDVLAALDLVVASVHSHFDLPPAQQTDRIVRALSHPLVNILAHPTGRLINQRPPIQFDLDTVLRCAVEHHVAVELNAQPDRLDLKDTHLMRARQLGAMLVISTDAHRSEQLRFMRYGVAQARRAWLERDHVINTRSLDGLMSALGKKSPSAP